MQQSDFNQLAKMMLISFGYNGENQFEMRQPIIKTMKEAIKKEPSLVARAIESDYLNDREKAEIIDTLFIVWIQNQDDLQITSLIKEYNFPPQFDEMIQMMRTTISQGFA